MDKAIQVLRTGDFWIDLGIRHVWSDLLARQTRTYRLNQKTVVEISSNDDDRLDLKATLFPSNIRIEYDNDAFLTQLLRDMLETTRPYYTGISKMGKEKWDKQGSFFSPIKQRSSFFEPPELCNNSRSKRKCAYCESDTFVVRQVGATNHPLIAIPGKFSSFYSNFRGDVQICEVCVFASKFSPLSIFYGISRNLLTAIAFESNDLVDLHSLLKEFSSDISTASSDYRNFRSTLGFTIYPLETFFDFVFSMIQGIERKKDLENRNVMVKGLLSKVHIIQGSLGKVLSLDKYHVIPNMPRVLDFITMCRWSSKRQKTYNCMLETTRWLAVKRQRDIDTTVREEFSRRLIYNIDATDLIENFLIANVEDQSLVPFVRINLDRFIRMYSLNMLQLDSKQLKLARLIGNSIGILAAEKEKSLLYNLRSIGNLESFVDFFHKLLVRYADEISELNLKDRLLTGDFNDLLQELNNTNWRIYKSLIGIYSALKFSEIIKPSSASNSKEPISQGILAK